MNELIFENNDDAIHLYTTSVLIHTYEAKEKRINSKVCYKLGKDYYPVEEFVRLLFEKNGFSSFNGVEFHRALSYLSYNFENNNTQEKNYMLKWNQELTLDNTNDMFNTLKVLRDNVVLKDKLDHEIIDLAEKLMKYYYRPAADKLLTITNIFEFLRKISTDELIKLIKFSYRIRGLSKGTPDILIFKDTEFSFVEVKSSNDSLSRYQILFINYFKEIVADNIFVLNIVDGDWN